MIPQRCRRVHGLKPSIFPTERGRAPPPPPLPMSWCHSTNTESISVSSYIGKPLSYQAMHEPTPLHSPQPHYHACARMCSKGLSDRSWCLQFSVTMEFRKDIFEEIFFLSRYFLKDDSWSRSLRGIHKTASSYCTILNHTVKMGCLQSSLSKVHRTITIATCTCCYGNSPIHFR